MEGFALVFKVYTPLSVHHYH